MARKSTWTTFAEVGAKEPKGPKGGTGPEKPSALRLWAARAAGEQTPVPEVRQRTDYTCGPAALLAALAFLGVQATEDELSNLAGTTDAGTPPEGLQAAAGAKGATAEIREGMTLDDLRTELDQGHVVIVAIQAWAETPPEGGYADVWEHGHYVVPTEVEEDGSVLVEDPSVNNARAKLGPGELEERWHDEDNHRRRVGLGVVVSMPGASKTPAHRPAGKVVAMG